jgi:uncharacterized protein with NRDE domain
MCLLALAIGASERWPLVLASNRDEHRARATLPLARWTSDKGATVISGRDLLAGGTWLGCTPQGRVAMLTNVREATAPTARLSRGDLPMDWLSGHISATDFLAQHDPRDYGGCNLIIGDYASAQWHWASNREFQAKGAGPARIQGGHSWNSQSLKPGIYGLSNAFLDTPWPKTLALKAAMQRALNKAMASGNESDLLDPLWAALASTERAAMSELPDTGVTVSQEHALSSALVDMPERAYGTRNSSLLFIEAGLVRTQCTATLCEKSWPGDTVRLQWSLTA